MIKRTMQAELISLSHQYPVVTITGPRQAGKTTLAKMCFPSYNYCNLEIPELRQLAASDPRTLFKQYPVPVIIDEVQHVPELLSYIQVSVDENDKKGQFILTGSHRLLLHQSVSQSLAGRTALLTLLPLSMQEISESGMVFQRDEYILRGFLPRIYKDNLDPGKAYRNYFQTYVERDVRNIASIRNLNLFEKFMYLLAGRIGQILNLHSIANDIGVSSTTLKEWLSVLEASYIIYLLKPYFENYGKRVTKSPKLYFFDTGLVSYLLGINNSDQVARDPLLGGLFENLIVIEALKARVHHGLDPELYFFRENNGNEVDIIFRQGRQLVPIEIKAAMTYNDRLTKSISFFHSCAGSTKGYLIYSGDFEFEKTDLSTINFLKTYTIFQ